MGKPTAQRTIAIGDENFANGDCGSAIVRRPTTCTNDLLKVAGSPWMESTSNQRSWRSL